MAEFHIASNLQKYRKRAGLRPAQLAETVGVTREQIWCYENSQRIPSVLILARLAKALKTTVDALLYEEDGEDECQDT